MPIQADSVQIEFLRTDNDVALVLKRHLPKPFNTKMAKYRVLDFMGFDVPVEYRSPADRSAFEESCMSLWKERGFSVPDLKQIPEGSDNSNTDLCMEYVEGERLDAFLASGRSQDEIMTTLNVILGEMRSRHCVAIFEGEHRLIHYDSNIRNIILVDGKPVYLDFEMGHLAEKIDASATRELKKHCLEVMNALEPDLVDPFVTLLCEAYYIRHILKRMVSEELDRRFLGHHLRRDEKRKHKNSRLVTKVDLARKIQDRLFTTGPAGGVNADDTLQKVLENSWDDRFYQSLDDTDPRGRDMGHRYGVMEFPQSLDGKSVLDIGCNLGRICLDAEKRGAERIVGIDYREDVINAMRTYLRNNASKVALYTFDINDGADALGKMIGESSFDYVFVLSIWSHVDQGKLWEIINKFCSHVCYFEDNAPSRVKSLESIERTLRESLKFSSMEFLGYTTDRGVRPVYRLTR